MSELLTIKRTTAEGVAEAIRRKTGKTDLLTSDEWAAEIESISGAEPLAEYRQQNPLVDQYLLESSFFSADDYSSTIPDFLEKFVYIEPEGYTRYYPLGYTSP